MSTFKGILKGFPDLRIDYFRIALDQRPPLVAFLSHVHSDHLQGLESLKSPFVYCSAATRELLFRLERYSQSMNFMKGILETRQVHYRHLKGLLKTIPLDTPTMIEMAPERCIQVTLLDANHCAGAVMFLIEDNRKAVLYTGDIRSEPWWVNSLARNPIIIPFICGQRKLDMVYLDTTFATRTDIFPTKAEGLAELLRKVSIYPKDTVFHFNAGTLGYEEVWLSLSLALKSQVHVDDYKLRLFASLLDVPKGDVIAQTSYALCGFKCGNRLQPGCLTSNCNVRLHSCEKDTNCEGLESARVVYINPTVSRTKCGAYIREEGINQDFSLEINDDESALQLINLCSERIKNEQILARAVQLISDSLKSPTKSLSLAGLNLHESTNAISLENIVELIAMDASREECKRDQGGVSQSRKGEGCKSLQRDKPYEPEPRFPDQIQFLYSRHSSYEELCHLVSVLTPSDVYPCSVDKEKWDKDLSIESLFGHLCSGNTFSYDNEKKSRLKWVSYMVDSQSDEHDPRVYNKCSPRQICDLDITMTDTKTIESKIQAIPPNYASNIQYRHLTIQEALISAPSPSFSHRNRRMENIKTCLESRLNQNNNAI